MIYLLVWFLPPFILIIYEFYKEGELKVNDLYFIVFFLALGPITLFLFIYDYMSQQEVREKVIWKRK